MAFVMDEAPLPSLTDVVKAAKKSKADEDAVADALEAERKGVLHQHMATMFTTHAGKRGAMDALGEEGGEATDEPGTYVCDV